MKTRTCPHCGYQYSRIDYIKKVYFKFSGNSWECLNCKQKITIDMKRRFLVAITFGLWFIIINTAKSYLDLDMDILMWIIFVFIFLIGSIFIFTFDTFKKADN